MVRWRAEIPLGAGSSTGVALTKAPLLTWMRHQTPVCAQKHCWEYSNSYDAGSSSRQALRCSS